MKIISSLCLSLVFASTLTYANESPSRVPVSRLPVDPLNGLVEKKLAPADLVERIGPTASPVNRTPGPWHPAQLKDASSHHARNILSQFQALYGEAEPEKSSGKVVPYVVGGSDVPPGDRGYQVSVQNLGGHYCGGALIADEWVLTAAHCLSPSVTAFGLSIMLGSADLQASEAQLVPVVDVLIHPNYDPVLANYDVAVLRLAEPAPESLPRLKLADETLMADFAQVGDVATVSGWGVLDNQYNTSPLLQQVDVPVVERAVCDAAYRDALGIGVTEQMICAGYPEGGRDSCFGDSGGPLTVTAGGEDYSIGVVSWGFYECALPGTPGVYARTASFRDWILEAVQSEPLIIMPVDPAEGATVSAAAGEVVLFSFELPESVRNLQIDLTGGEGDADLLVFNGPYLLPNLLSCSSVSGGSDETCFYSLAAAGIYTVAVSAFTDIANVQLSLSYEPVSVANGTVIENISAIQGQVISLVLEVAEPGQDIRVALAGGQGDADLWVTQLDAPIEGSLSCMSADTSSDEECLFQDAPPGVYLIQILAYTGFEGVALTVEVGDAQPFFPMAICEHQVVAQFGQYFIASIDIVNVSDQYLENWYVSWDYSVPTEIRYIQNGIITARSPYQAASPESGRALAPGASTNIYFLVKSPLEVAENPAVTGNFCF